ncbi:MAG TPA: OmpA family protein [Allosphingosinicella sp.]|nr:OmpA family protein [Allosphingosinicella sp.]
MYDPFVVFFNWNNEEITGETATILGNVARVYSPLAHCEVTITGHTDRSGEANYNLALSRRRAEAVGVYLRQHGVTARSRIEPYGEERPLVETPDGQRDVQNRRSEILVGNPR